MIKLPAALNIDVRRSDIENGKRCHTHLCPIALAFKRRTGAAQVNVDYEGISIPDDGTGQGADRVYRITDAVEFFMARFDSRQRVQPMRVTLEAYL